ncbi:MAG: hypothetical protein KC468_21920 [Myxococcales bacterium]|nr:hypothetical protein [Myxococcales bacterium]
MLVGVLRQFPSTTPRARARSIAGALLGLGLVASASAACTSDSTETTAGSDSGDTSDASESDETSGATSGSSETTSDGAMTTGSDASDSDTGDAAPVYEYARGIRLTSMSANQGVAVDIVRDGVALPEDEYSSRLVAGRYTLLRAHWNLHADFEPRELIGRLTLTRADGTRYVDDFTVMVGGPSTDASLTKTFSWLLPPEEVVAGMQYRVEAFEADAATAAGEVSEPPPVLPLPGPGALALHTSPMRMQVTLVPVLHQLDGCEQAPVITDADVKAMREELEQANPVQEAILTVREPMPYTDPIGGQANGFSPMLNALSMLREADAPPDNVYYYGLMESCDGYPSGLLGQALGIPSAPLPELAHQRVATGRYWGNGADAAETFVHEVGHSQGRYHIACTGGEAGTDSSYPHSNGRIGVWGFGIHDHQLRSPTRNRDYMTYCQNEWVSDFGWEKVFDVIETLTSWEMSARAEDDARASAVLIGALEPDGTSTWWTARGSVPAADLTPGVTLTLTGPDGARELAAHHGLRPDSSTYNVFAPLPDDVARYTALELRAAGELLVSRSLEDVRVLHERSR